jgi:hypothetical protein
MDKRFSNKFRSLSLMGCLARMIRNISAREEVPPKNDNGAEEYGASDDLRAN